LLVVFSYFIAVTDAIRRTTVEVCRQLLSGLWIEVISRWAYCYQSPERWLEATITL